MCLLLLPYFFFTSLAVHCALALHKCMRRMYIQINANHSQRGHFSYNAYSLSTYLYFHLKNKNEEKRSTSLNVRPRTLMCSSRDVYRQHTLKRTGLYNKHQIQKEVREMVAEYMQVHTRLCLCGVYNTRGVNVSFAQVENALFEKRNTLMRAGARICATGLS